MSLDNTINLPDKYRILNLDPSYRCTGLSVLEVSHEEPFNYKDAQGNGINIKLLDYGIIPTNLSDIGKSLLVINEYINNTIEKYKPDYITSEQSFMSANRQTGMRLSQVHGVLQLIAAQNHFKIVYYSVMTAKSQTLNGMKMKKDDGTKKTGDEMKQEVADEIIRILGKEQFTKDYTLDVTDSISMGITFIKMDGQETEKKKKTKKKTTTAKKETKIKKESKSKKK